MVDDMQEFYDTIHAAKEFGDSKSIGEVLEKYYSTKVGTGVWDKLPPVIPAILYPTHVATIINGVSKSISISDFKNILSSVSSGDEGTTVPPMALPFGCFLFNRTGDSLYLNCYYNEVNAKVFFNSGSRCKEEYLIPIPNVIISFILKKVDNTYWQVDQVKYYSTDKSVTQLPEDKFLDLVKPSIGMYKLPMPNMYGDNRMCFGGNTMPVRFTNNLRGLDYYYQILTQAPFNGDLSINGLTSSYSARGWLDYLQDEQKFPYHLLTKSLS